MILVAFQWATFFLVCSFNLSYLVSIIIFTFISLTNVGIAYLSIKQCFVWLQVSRLCLFLNSPIYIGVYVSCFICSFWSSFNAFLWPAGDIWLVIFGVCLLTFLSIFIVYFLAYFIVIMYRLIRNK